MLQILDSLKSLISPEMISKASAVLGEDNAKTSSAVSSMVPGLLGSLLHKGDTPQVRSVLEDAGKSNLLTDMSSLFTGAPTEKQRSIGNRFMDAVLGSKASDFISVISSHSGISTNSASKLTGMITPVIAGFLGNKLNSGQFNLSGLMNELNKEKSSFMGMIPAGLTGILGLTSLSDLGKNLNTRINTATTTTNRAAVSGITDEPKGKYGWLKWLIAILLLVLLFFWWRSCNNNDRTVDRNVAVSSDTLRATVVETAAPTTVEARQTTDIALPDNSTITGYRNGTEERLLTYLRSDRYKDAKDSDLKEDWYSFDNITFEFGSATKLTDGSERQLDNVAKILDNYDNVKIKVGGYADRVGDNDDNMELSEERAETVKRMLIAKGVPAGNITTEGFGEELAKYSANAPESDRVHDRHVALRLTK